jgi:hypothetical protein
MRQMVLDLWTYLTWMFESCGSVSTLGATELFAMEKKWSGITLGLRGKRPVILKHEVPFETEQHFRKLFQ